MYLYISIADLYLIICLVYTKSVVSFECNGEIGLYGGGSILPSRAYREAAAAYVAKRQFIGRNVRFGYKIANSAYAKQRMFSQTDGMGNESPLLSFAGTESLMTVEEQRKYPHLTVIPTFAGGLAIIYNLPGVTNLTLDLAHLPLIYMGEIHNWNDERLQIENPGIKLPAEKILPVARADSAGQTELLTNILGIINATWRRLYGTIRDPQFAHGHCCNSTAWPPGIVKYFGVLTSGVVGLVASIPYTIGFAELDSSFQSVAGIANFRIVPGLQGPTSTVAPTSQSIYAAMALHQKEAKQRLTFPLFTENSIESYPLAVFAYMIINTNATPNISCCQMEELIGFISFLLYEADRAMFQQHHLVPLHPFIANQVVETVLKKIKCDDQLVWDDYWASVKSAKQSDTYFIAAATAVIAMALIGVLYILWKLYRSYKNISDSSVWNLKNVEVCKPAKRSLDTLQPTLANCAMGRWRDQGIRLYKMSHSSITTSLGLKQKLLLQRLSELQHSNVLRFYGVTSVSAQHEQMLISEPIQYWLAVGIAEGMEYLHEKRIIHGQLSSLNVLLDITWTPKIANWTEFTLKKVNVGGMLSLANIIRLIYADPWYFGKDNIENPAPADVYAFGLLLVEIFTLRLPFQDDNDELGVEWPEIFKDKFSQGGKTDMRQIEKIKEKAIAHSVINCVRDPIDRPSLKWVNKHLHAANPHNKGVVEELMDKMSKQINTLEMTTNQLQTTTERMKELIYAVLPPAIAEKFLANETVKPEYFESISIMFTDIVGFTAICSMSTPLQVMQMLNSIWIHYDRLLDQFDAYKVDTIGDAYMVCSGLPTRNGAKHAAEAARISLKFLQCCNKIKVCHLPEQRIRMRFGINSGPVTAGIIGHKMPQYCVFGDTVNTASRMESTSLPLQIQVSESTYALLQANYSYEQFMLELRGTINVKGKGRMKTYWLKGIHCSPINGPE